MKRRTSAAVALAALAVRGRMGPHGFRAASGERTGVRCARCGRKRRPAVFGRDDEPDASRQLPRVGVPQLQPRLDVSASGRSGHPAGGAAVPERLREPVVVPRVHADGEVAGQDDLRARVPAVRRGGVGEQGRAIPVRSRRNRGRGEGRAIPGRLGVLRVRSDRPARRRPSARRRPCGPMHRMPHRSTPPSNGPSSSSTRRCSRSRNGLGTVKPNYTDP